jgi:nucleoside-diphosphate-sugar epimerase
MDSHSKVVLITGINGFTGRYLMDFLISKNYKVYGITNQKDQCNSTVFYSDILNLEQLKKILNKIKPNYVFHLAAISFVQHENISEIYNVNVIGTQNLLEACLDNKENLKKIILASSATVYGTQKTDVIYEELCPNPINHYGISKYAMEQIAKNFFNELPLIITRPFNYTAPGHNEQFVIPKIAKAFKNKELTLELGNLDVFREYNSIEYVCDVYYKLMESDVTSEIINIASGRVHSLNQIIEVFKAKSNHDINIQINPNFVRKDEVKSLMGSTLKLYKLIENKDISSNSIEKIIESFLK